jgi:cyclopropane fatty-acyl-phospholipid synthase-like methyltransferase
VRTWGTAVAFSTWGAAWAALFLSELLNAHVAGITISPVQVEIGNALARQRGADVQIFHMDAEALDTADRFAVAWSVEAISHLSNRGECFRSIVRAVDAI